MPELPASVRLSLWATAALARQSCSLEEAVERATPDIAEIDAAPAVARLDLWSQLGERVVLVSLPAPGDLVGLPRGGMEFVGAAVDAEECVWSPLIGGALVPTIEAFGPDADRGEIVRWESFDTTPRDVSGLGSIGEVERHLRGVLLQTTDALEGLDAPGWKDGLRDLADRRLAEGRWGLPEQIDARIAGVLRQSATLSTITGTALGTVHDAPSLRTGQERDRLLREAGHAARQALAHATCLAALDLAG